MRQLEVRFAALMIIYTQMVAQYAMHEFQVFGSRNASNAPGTLISRNRPDADV